MSESWDECASEWDANMEAISYAEKAFKSLDETLNLEELRVLDFGCGTGLLTERLSSVSKEIVALDSSKKMISVLNDKSLPNVSTLAIPLTKETIIENHLLHDYFDLIVASSVCGFLEDYENTLKLVKKLLSNGGIFVQWDWLSSDNKSDFGFTEDRVRAALRNTGMKNMSITQPFSLTSSKGMMKVLMAVAKNA